MSLLRVDHQMMLSLDWSQLFLGSVAQELEFAGLVNKLRHLVIIGGREKFYEISLSHFGSC